MLHVEDLPIKLLAKLAGVVEYNDCIYAEGSDFLQWVSWYDTKQSDSEAPVMLELWGMCNPIYQPLRSGRIWHKLNF